MGGFALEPDRQILDNHDPNYPKRLAITTAGIKKLAEGGDFLTPDPETIADKSKADGLAKGLVIFQVTWMVLQVSARKVSGYPLTLLEVHILVHALCALMMYGIWFKKPTGVRDPTVVDSSLGQKLLGTNLQWRSQYPRLVLSRLVNYYQENVSTMDGGQIMIQWSMVMFVCSAYGGVHAAAWNFEFPSDAERLLWRVSSVTVIAGSLAVSLWSWVVSDEFISDKTKQSTATNLFEGAWNMLRFSSNFDDSKPFWIETFWYMVSVFLTLSAPVVFCARVAIVIEAFISLRHVPEGAYALVRWTQYIPHF
ncbi:hypothetical protein K440DRAFT_607575 [Wilcoxina mikolae CBS 423.85]|nr:hypothetical protein K440DRAFT_607575 [Wilcoxina mikolae CBS 423.85]